MKKHSLDFFIGKTITEIHQITVEENGDEFVMDDSLVFKTSDNKMYQLLANYTYTIYALQKINDAVIIGEYDRALLKFKSIPVKLFNVGVTIEHIYKYEQGTYHFGSKFLGKNNEYLFGICFGWDELLLINKIEFNKMIDNYKNVTLTIVS